MSKIYPIHIKLFSIFIEVQLFFISPFLALLLALSSTDLAFGNESFSCSSGNVKYVFNRKQYIKPFEFCMNADQSQVISENCYKKSCIANKQPPFMIDPSEFLFPMGTPGFHLCSKLGGTAQLVEYQVNEKWYPGSRCYFAKDHSFVSPDYLFHLWNTGEYGAATVSNTE